ncbi:MAG TPA: GNAT family N-acetyltransferase [Candidatus Dormibacteraeota bacterium]|nr:GNAT family N-acetyltransferase [Candidatus Dormibacteraeota bacterium]
MESASSELEEAVGRLLPQLSEARQAPTGAELARLVADPAVTMLVARRDGDGAIVGAALVAVFARLTGTAGRLEDVVVDAAARGEGVGAALVGAAVGVARERGAVTMELTTGPWREAANRLYPRLGFRRRETNVYTIEC